MTTQTTFETGATHHAVNELILFTDTSRNLAELRDKIYEMWAEKGYPMSEYAFQELLRASINQYVQEIGLEDSLHIKYMGNQERDEYKRVYASRFSSWKKEHGY